MRLIQFNIYYNRHLHIKLHYVYHSHSGIGTCVSVNSWPPIHTYVSANNISFVISLLKFVFPHILHLYHWLV